jgi:proteic killer suppression protein
MEYYGSGLERVDLGLIQRQLKRTPGFVVKALQEWVLAVETFGLREVRKIKGYHDEPLRGERQGQRSVRLNRKWRLIYSERVDGTVHIVVVEEVTPHDYRTK